MHNNFKKKKNIHVFPLETQSIGFDAESPQ